MAEENPITQPEAEQPERSPAEPTDKESENATTSDTKPTGKFESRSYAPII